MPGQEGVEQFRPIAREAAQRSAQARRGSIDRMMEIAG